MYFFTSIERGMLLLDVLSFGRNVSPFWIDLRPIAQNVSASLDVHSFGWNVELFWINLRPIAQNVSAFAGIPSFILLGIPKFYVSANMANIGYEKTK